MTSSLECIENLSFVNFNPCSKYLLWVILKLLKEVGMWSIKCKIYVTVLFEWTFSQIFMSETKIGLIIRKYKNLIEINQK